MVQKVYMEFNFTVLQLVVARTLKLKSVNCMEIYYTTAMTSEHKTGLRKIKIHQLLT